MTQQTQSALNEHRPKKSMWYQHILSRTTNVDYNMWDSHVLTNFMLCRLVNNKRGYSFRAGNLRNVHKYLPYNMLYHLATLKYIQSWRILNMWHCIALHPRQLGSSAVTSNLASRTYARSKNHPQRLRWSRGSVLPLTLRRLMSYIYGAPILDVSRSHTTTQHSR